MSPMFGRGKEENEKRVEEHRCALRAESERLEALPLKALAAEVMTKGFGRGSPGADDDGNPGRHAGPPAEVISFEFVPARGFTRPLATIEDGMLRDEITKFVNEGLQELEHAGLVRSERPTTRSNLHWMATRRGRDALERGELRNILDGASG